MIELANIQKSYGSLKVLDGLDLTINKADFVAIMGKSGSGKTTLLNILGLLDLGVSGSYKIDSQLILAQNKNLIAARRNSFFGFVFQNFLLLPRFTVFENICLPLQYSNKDVKVLQCKVKELMYDMDVLHLSDAYPCKLSGGQQQRVALCRALVCEPEVILADEPTGSLDKDSARNIINILTQLNHYKKITICIITHDQYIANCAERRLCLTDGQLYAV
jgi:ABC-type lipoprotein export system ATPase subunit